MTHFPGEAGSPLHTPFLSPIVPGAPPWALREPLPLCVGPSLCTRETRPGRLAKAVTSLRGCPPRLASPVPPHLLPVRPWLQDAVLSPWPAWDRLSGMWALPRPHLLPPCPPSEALRTLAQAPLCFASFGARPESLWVALPCSPPSRSRPFGGFFTLPHFHCITQASLNLDPHEGKGRVSLISV